VRKCESANARAQANTPSHVYSTCLACHAKLGSNEELESFPTGSRLAFDPERGRLWAVCPSCGRWNLTALEERWEALEQCERRFQRSHLRAATDNIGLARLPSGLDLIRVGRAPRTEIAAWRYGRRLPPPVAAFARARGLADRAADRALARLARSVPALRRRYEPSTWLRIHRQPERVIDAVPLGDGSRALVRYRHLERAELVRPGRLEPWLLAIDHETGPILLSGDAGLRAAGRIFAAMNGSATDPELRAALQRLEEAGDPDGYFSRVARLALRTSWGREPDAPRDLPVVPGGASASERLALQLTSRSFWARGGTGSEARTLLPWLPFVDRLALEMAANEERERRALEGEMEALEAAWREAEEIAAIADGLFDARAAAGCWQRLALATG
jgi:hypothetical protein